MILFGNSLCFISLTYIHEAGVIIIAVEENEGPPDVHKKILRAKSALRITVTEALFEGGFKALIKNGQSLVRNYTPK